MSEECWCGKELIQARLPVKDITDFYFKCPKHGEGWKLSQKQVAALVAAVRVCEEVVSWKVLSWIDPANEPEAAHLVEKARELATAALSAARAQLAKEREEADRTIKRQDELLDRYEKRTRDLERALAERLAYTDRKIKATEKEREGERVVELDYDGHTLCTHDLRWNTGATPGRRVVLFEGPCRLAIRELTEEKVEDDPELERIAELLRRAAVHPVVGPKIAALLREHAGGLHVPPSLAKRLRARAARGGEE